MSNSKKVVQEELKDCCQVCKSHKNKPSRCVWNEEFFVPRKQEPCDSFKRRS